MTAKTPISQLSDDEKAAAVTAYNKIAPAARLQDVRLVKYDFEAKPEFYSAISTEGPPSPKLSFDHSFASIQYTAEHQLLMGEIHWNVVGKIGRTTPLKIGATYLIAYANVPDVGLPHVEEFMKRVGRFAVYPYFRAFVAQTSWAAMTDLPVLPILR